MKNEKQKLKETIESKYKRFYELVCDYYEKVDKMMTEEQFRHICDKVCEKMNKRKLEGITGNDKNKI